MPPSLFQSQFDTLKMLEPDETGALVDVHVGIEEVTEASMTALREAADGQLNRRACPRRSARPGPTSR